MLKNKLIELAFKIVKKDFFYANAKNSEGSPRTGILKFNNNFFTVERGGDENWRRPVYHKNSYYGIFFNFIDNDFLCEINIRQSLNYQNNKWELMWKSFEFIGDEEAFKEKAVLMFLST